MYLDLLGIWGSKQLDPDKRLRQLQKQGSVGHTILFCTSQSRKHVQHEKDNVCGQKR